ncbi:hypothetical protein DFH28DRAFT_878885 [Melampsora americana]|nr:hypothetical protein DFH28DRAFT_878885 [Melampsora americana]
MESDQADKFLDSIAHIITPSRAKIQLEMAQEEIKDQRSKLIFLQNIYQVSKNSTLNLSNDPNHLILLSEFEQTVDLYERQLTKLELAYEMKKHYALEVLKLEI